MASALIGRLFEEYKTIRTYTGAELENMEYEPLFSLPSELLENKKAYYVTCADYVTLSDGSGIVHIAPAYGEDDSLVSKQNGITKP